MTRAEDKAMYAWAVYEYREHPKGLYHTCFVDGYQQGYNQAEKDLGWHSVDESLPPMDEEVIVLTDILVDGGLDAGFGRIAFGHIVDTKRRIDYDGWNIPGVRYWMPMPKIKEG